MMRNEAGIAMVTVLFVGAVMTVTVSAAAFVAVSEYRAAGDDRGSTSALALSEAGIDRTIQWMRSNRVPWRFIVLSGCGTVAGVNYEPVTLNGRIGDGTYSTVIKRATPCPAAVPSPRVAQQLILSSTGCTQNTVLGAACPTGSAKRVVEQAVALSSRPLPVGMSANRVDTQGSPSFRNMVVIARGIVSTRKQITISGTDPYYKKSDFYPCVGTLSAAAGQCFTVGAANDLAMPASAHSTDRIFLNPNGTNEHPPNPNCTNAGYLWDGSATGGTVTGTACGQVYPNRPPTTLFTDVDADRIARDPRLSEEDHLFFKQIAQQSGLYCSNYGSAASTCQRGGTAPLQPCLAPCAAISGDMTQADVTGLGNYFVVYVEYPAGSDPARNMLVWDVASPLPTQPCNTATPANTMIVVIVRNGSFTTRANFMGAIFAEDGRYEIGGNVVFEGTVAAQYIRTRGSPTVCNSQRWVDSMPGIFLQAVPLQWSEVDR